MNIKIPNVRKCLKHKTAPETNLLVWRTNESGKIFYVEMGKDYNNPDCIHTVETSEFISSYIIDLLKERYSKQGMLILVEMIAQYVNINQDILNKLGLQLSEIKDKPCYVFDTTNQQWYKENGEVYLFKNRKWVNSLLRQKDLSFKYIAVSI